MSDLIERVPPHDLDAEASILSACLLDKHALSRCVTNLSPADFYRRPHQDLFSAMCELFQARKPIDVITLRDALGHRFEGIGGAGYLIDLMGSHVTAAHVPYHAKILKEKSQRRALIALCSEGMADLFETGDPDAVLKVVSKMIGFQVAGKQGHQVASLAEVVGAEHDRIAALVERRANGDTSEVRAITFGLPDVDHELVVDKGDMLILGARPSAGKSALGVQVAVHNAGEGRRVLFYSLEMSRQSLARRYLTTQTRVSAYRQLTGYVGTQEMVNIACAEDTVKGLRGILEIDDRPGLTVAQMHAGIVQRLQENGTPIDLVVVDHLIKVRSTLRPDASGHARLTQISSDMKELARTTKIPFLVLTQLRRPAQGQEDKEPAASDLRESGSLEEDADAVMLLHRPERAGSITQAKLLLEKQRNGPVGSYDLVYDCERTTFRCLEKFGSLA